MAITYQIWSDAPSVILTKEKAKRTRVNRCADRRPTWAELRIVLNGLKRGQAALNCGRSGPEARNNQHPTENVTEPIFV